jgi:hypothetical protein
MVCRSDAAFFNFIFPIAQKRNKIQNTNHMLKPSGRRHLTKKGLLQIRL